MKPIIDKLGEDVHTAIWDRADDVIEKINYLGELYNDVPEKLKNVKIYESIVHVIDTEYREEVLKFLGGKKLYLYGQNYMECQLVTAINAGIRLGERRIDPESAEYERLVDLVGARHGSAICVEKAIDYLRMDCIPIEPTKEALVKSLESGYPVEIGVWTEERGYHSICATEWDGMAEVLVHNLSDKDKGYGEWVEWYYLDSITTKAKNVGRLEGKFGQFKLQERFS